MIKNIIEMLNLSEWYGISYNIDVAKGLYKAPSNMEETKDIINRVGKSKAYRNG